MLNVKSGREKRKPDSNHNFKTVSLEQWLIEANKSTYSTYLRVAIDRRQIGNCPLSFEMTMAHHRLVVCIPGMCRAIVTKERYSSRGKYAVNDTGKKTTMFTYFFESWLITASTICIRRIEATHCTW